jgi:hypothetical protein
MAIDTETRASRRNVLAAALGGLGGLLAGRLGSPDSAQATDGDPAVLGTANTSNTETSFVNLDGAETSLKGFHGADGVGVEAAVGGPGYGLKATASGSSGRAVFATSLNAAGVTGHSTATTGPDLEHPGQTVGVVGIAGDGGGISSDLSETGVYGFCDTTFQYAVGVWGDTFQGIGVVGSGDWGVLGAGTSIGVFASGPIALRTSGKLVFAGRSGHNYVRAGHYYVDIYISGMTSAADVIATLRTRKAGYYIAAVISYTGKFRLFLNKGTTTNVWFNFLVLN